MFNRKLREIVIIFIFLLALFTAAGTAWAQPPGIPPSYSGTVYIGGTPSGAGLSVTVGIGDWKSDYSSITDSSGYYEPIAVIPPESASGTIYFYINGVQATETAIFSADGSSNNLDLHIAALPSTTPTAIPTPTTAPTPTPEPISSNGSATIEPSGGTVKTGDGTITITFPAGAFSTPTYVSIQAGTCQHGATADFVVGSTCFNVTPDAELGAAATICVNLSASDFIIVENHSDLTLGYWSGDSWQEAANITLSGITLCGQTTHLSDWAVLGTTGNDLPIPSNTDGGGTNWSLIGGIAGGVLLLILILLIVKIIKRRYDYY